MTLATTNPPRSRPVPAPDWKGRGAVYSRISGENDTRTASLDTQEGDCLALANDERFRVGPEDVFREQRTGYESLEDRDVLTRLRDAIAAKTYQALFVYDTDRLARDPTALMQVVTEAERKGCKVYFKNMPHDNTPTGRLLLYVRGFASEWEYLQIRDRTMRGRRKIMEQGQVPGNAAVRYGYIRIKEERRRVANPETAPIVREIFRLVADEGWSLNRVVAHLNATGVPCPGDYRGQNRKHGKKSMWGNTTIADMIRDETYLGIATAKRKKKVGKKWVELPREEWTVLHDGRTEALVDRDLFDRANAALRAANTSSLPSARTRNAKKFQLFRGILFCGECGCRMSPYPVCSWNPLTRDYTGAKIVAFRCISRYRQTANRTNCRGANVYPNKVASAVWLRVVEIIQDESLLDAEVARLKASRPGEQVFREALQDTRAKLTGVTRRISNWIVAMGEADDVETRAMLRDQVALARREKESLEEQARRLDAKLAMFDEMDRRADEVHERATKVREGLARPEDFTDQERRDVLEWLNVRLVGNGTNVRILIDLGADEAAGDSLVSLECSGRMSLQIDQRLSLSFLVDEPPVTDRSGG
jgi:site-specific DNA recombinase